MNQPKLAIFFLYIDKRLILNCMKVLWILCEITMWILFNLNTLHNGIIKNIMHIKTSTNLRTNFR